MTRRNLAVNSLFFASLWQNFAQLSQKVSQSIATFLIATVFCLGIGTFLLPTPIALGATVLFCPGLDGVGNPYTATYLDGFFTEVKFDRTPDLPPVTTELTYSGENEQGEPIYRGAYLGMADVILIDLSKGNVKPGSEVSVAVDNNWNQERGLCGV